VVKFTRLAQPVARAPLRTGSARREACPRWWSSLGSLSQWHVRRFALAPLAGRPAAGGEVHSARSASGSCAASHWLRSPGESLAMVRCVRLTQPVARGAGS